MPWAHLDIAGSAWDLDRAYVGKGASGYGVRLLVELARSYAAELTARRAPPTASGLLAARVRMRARWTSTSRPTTS